MCLAAVLPILMAIVVYALLRYRSLQMNRKKFVDDWNVARINSYRNKITSHKHPISHISSSYLDANYLPEKVDNIELKRVSTSLIPGETSVSAAENQRTLQHFNDAYVEDSSMEEGSESLTTRSGSKSQGAFHKNFLIHRASSRASISSQTTNVKSAIVQMLNPQNKISLERNKTKHNLRTSVPQESESEIICDQTPTKKGSGKEGDDAALSVQHRISHDINSVNKYNRMGDLNQVKPNEFSSSETILNPQLYTGSIDRVGTRKLLRTNFLEPNYNPSEEIARFENDKTISSLINTDVFFQSQKIRSVKSQKNKEIHWELPEVAKSKDALLSELDYFASPVMSEEENNPVFGGRVYSDSTPKARTDNFLMPYQIIKKNHQGLVGGHSNNPLYKEKQENLSSENGLRSSRDWRALEYYKTHGDISLERDGTTDGNDTLDEEWPKLHRYPGVLDLNTILETNEGAGNGKSRNNSKDKNKIVDERTEFSLEDHILPPPPSFCDSDKPDLILPNMYPKSKPLRFSPQSFKSSINPKALSESFPLQDFKTSHGNNHDTSRRTDSDYNLFDSLPEVQAKNKFLERRTLSRKSRQNSSQLIFNKDSILKEEEELALKYFEDVCRELSIDSQNTSENGSDDKQPIENITNYRPFPQKNFDFKSSSNAPVAGNFREVYAVSTTKQSSATGGQLQPPNFRMSYEHLLSPDYPYQRRKVISSEINVNSKIAENLWSSKSGASKLITANNALKGESMNDSQARDGWIVTHIWILLILKRCDEIYYLRDRFLLRHIQL